MKKIFSLLTLASLVFCAVTSCKKTKVDDLTPANVITITTDMANVNPAVVITNDSIALKQNDSLTVNILLSQTLPTDNLSYEWMITQTTATIGNPAQYKVGTSKGLKTKITLAPDLYRLVIRVTDNTTGVSFYKFYVLNVDTAPWGGEGWLVLQDQGTSGCDLSVITTRDGAVHGSVYSNVYSLANNKKLPAGTYGMNVMDYEALARFQKVSFFYPNGGVQVKATDFSDSSVHNSWFLVPPAVANFEANGTSYESSWEYIINNGQLHSRQVNSLTMAAPPLVFGAPILGSWTLSPFVMHVSGSNSQNYNVYDKVNRCFLVIVGGSGLLNPNIADIPNKHLPVYAGGAAALHPVTGSGFDMNNMRHNLIYAEPCQLPLPTNWPYNCIFRNDTGDSTFLYQFPVNLTYLNNFTAGRFFLNPANVPGINTATKFASPTFLAAPGVFYYVADNNIYVCNIASLATSTSHIGKAFPAGTIIKDMKVFKSRYRINMPATEGRVLVVATDETASGGGNKVYFFNLTATGEISATPADVYTGFDKITSIVFKKKLGA